MTASSIETGGDFLERKSNVSKQRTALPKLHDVLVVDDSDVDANRLKATLRVIFGYEVEVRRAATLASAVDCVLNRQPDLIFLDDVLKPSDSAIETIPFLHHAKYQGPIIVVSGEVTRTRRVELLAAGATEVIHKDDVDSVRLTEAMVQIFSR
jgi:DNA-binding NarL/FixJ family response regulator